MAIETVPMEGHVLASSDLAGAINHQLNLFIRFIMCGIAGRVTFSADNVRQETIESMTDSLAHRGPDGRGLWTSRHVGLGHRRLSIIDLSAEAAQPMHSADGGLHIVFNGEIYNYRDLARTLESGGRKLRTNSDTEVILHLYALHGMKAFEMLRGMFAFALWDSGKNELLLVRDRLGIKPLYYLSDGKRFLFASEIKAIAVASPQLTFNKASFFRFLRTATSQGTETVFTEVKRLEPGCILRVSADHQELHRYWDLRTIFDQPISNPENETEAIRGFQDVLSEAVKYHLVADVPVGGFLSGGLDSSTVMGYMRLVAPETDIKTFSIAFPQSPGFDEQKYAKEASRHLNTIHTAVEFKGDFLRDIDALAWSCDEPFGILASYALYALAREASKKTKVVMTGDGGDELLAGYQGYLKSTQGYAIPIRAMLRVGGELSRFLTPITPVFPNQFITAWIKALRKTGTDGFRFSEQTAYSSVLDFAVLNDEYISEAWKIWRDNNGALYYDALSGDSDLRRKLFSSLKVRLVDEMLTKVDRMTMAHSLEARVPLLDHVLVEHVIKLPDDLKLCRTSDSKVEGKYILKRAAESVIPRELIYREKHGFDIPFHQWLMEGVFRELGDLIMNGVLVREHILDRDRLSRMLDQHHSGKSDHAQLIANLFVFERWFHVYTTRIPGFHLAF